MTTPANSDPASHANSPGRADAEPLSVRLMRLEHFALYALALVLPLFEVPKNLLWLAYVGLWFANRMRSRDFGGPWRGWDTLIACWIASGYVVAAFAGIQNQEWAGANDILRYGCVLWMVSRAGYSHEVLARMGGCILAGTALALAWGAIGLGIGQRSRLGLRSVGHVNHSAIYLSIAFGLLLVWLRAGWKSVSGMTRFGGLVLAIAYTGGLFIMESRAAVGAAFVSALVVLGIYAVRARSSVRKVLLASVVLLGMVLAIKPEVIEKNQSLLKKDLFLANRDAVWKTSLAAWREYPLFGVGMKNHSRISYERLEAWAASRGEAFDRRSVVLSSHAHSLYLNTLAERGLAGLLVLLAVLGAWLLSLVRGLPEATAPPLVWAYWGGAAFAWLVAVIVGLANTTLHSEHALLSMLLLGGWLSLSRMRPLQPRPDA